MQCIWFPSLCMLPVPFVITLSNVSLATCRLLWRMVCGFVHHHLLIQLLSILMLIGWIVRLMVAHYHYDMSLVPNLIAWRSKKQPTIFESSTKTEYRAIGHIVAETVWLRKFLYNPDVSISALFCLYCGNVSGSSMYANPMQHDRSKHIDAN